jgi:hypothetical protein
LARTAATGGGGVDDFTVVDEVASEVEAEAAAGGEVEDFGFEAGILSERANAVAIAVIDEIADARSALAVGQVQHAIWAIHLSQRASTLTRRLVLRMICFINKRQQQQQEKEIRTKRSFFSFSTDWVGR